MEASFSSSNPNPDSNSDSNPSPNPNSDSNPNPNSNSDSSPNPNPNSGSNPNSNSDSNPNPNLDSDSNPNSNSDSNPNPNPNSDSNPNPNSNQNPSSKSNSNPNSNSNSTPPSSSSEKTHNNGPFEPSERVVPPPSDLHKSINAQNNLPGASIQKPHANHARKKYCNSGSFERSHQVPSKVFNGEENGISNKGQRHVAGKQHIDASDRGSNDGRSQRHYQKDDSKTDSNGRINALGRTLTRILRHQATQLNLDVRDDGYVPVKEILKLNMRTRIGLPLSSHSEDDILKAIEQDNKQRFGKIFENGELLIRANQGHTIKAVETEKLLKAINDAKEFPVCVHGTFNANWESIRKGGLNKMKRNHVHFASGLPHDGVQSGIRSNCEVLIHLNLEKALKDGMKFYVSENGVILTEGVNGIVPPKYFLKVVKWPSNQVIIEDLDPLKQSG